MTGFGKDNPVNLLEITERKQGNTEYSVTLWKTPKGKLSFSFVLQSLYM